MKEIALRLFANHYAYPNVAPKIAAGYEVMVFWEEEHPYLGKVFKYYPTLVNQAKEDLFRLLKKAESTGNYYNIGMVRLEDLQ